MPSINGKKFKNEGHRVGPYPIFRNVEEEVEVDVLDDDGEPVIDEATGKPEKTTEIQRVEKVYQIFAEPVWSFKQFNELYPKPLPPVGGWSPKTKEKEQDFKDPQYLQDLDEYNLAREGWTLMTSLAPSNIELDGVNMKDPRTWSGIKPKLQAVEGGLFSFYEYNAIVDLIDEACGISDEKIEANRKSFLAGTQAAKSVKV
jgi:hypothetical protein